MARFLIAIGLAILWSACFGPIMVAAAGIAFSVGDACLEQRIGRTPMPRLSAP
jgi:hypothetical protein